MSKHSANVGNQGNTNSFLQDDMVEMNDVSSKNNNFSQRGGSYTSNGGVSARHTQRQPGFAAKIESKVMSIIHFIIPPGGILAGAFNMAAASIGAGILGLPSATEATGLVLAMIILLIITLYSVFSMYILALAAQQTRLKSFEGMAHWLFPHFHNGFAYWVSFMRWFYSFSACVAYVISLGNCLEPIFHEAVIQHPGNKTIHYFSTQAGNRVLTSVIWVCIMLPLVIPKHVDSLRIPSMLAVLFMLFFGIIIIVHSILNGFKINNRKIKFDDRNIATNDPDTVYLFRSGNGVLTALGTFIFAYVCQINGLEIFHDMPPAIRTPANYTLSAMIAMLICGTLYALVCIFGYFDFGSTKLHGNSILLMYNPLKEPVILVSYIAVLFKLCVAYALQSSAARNSMYYIIGWQIKYHTPKVRQFNYDDNAQNNINADNAINSEIRCKDSKTDREYVANIASPVKPVNYTQFNQELPGRMRDIEPNILIEVDTEPVEAEEDLTYIDNIPFWKHFIAVLIMAIISLLCGLFIPKINTVLGYAGSLSGGFVAFVCPALYYMYAGNFGWHEAGWFCYLGTYSLLLCGVIGIVFGTCGSIYDTM